MDLFKHIATVNTAELFGDKKPVVIIGDHHSGKTLAGLGLAVKAACESETFPVNLHLVGMEERPESVMKMIESATRNMEGIDFDEKSKEGKIKVYIWPLEDAPPYTPKSSSGDVHMYDSMMIMSHPGAKPCYEPSSERLNYLSETGGVKVIAICTPGLLHSKHAASLVAKAYKAGQCFATEKVGGDLVIDRL